MAETTLHGVITEMHPNAHFLVCLDDGRFVTPSLSGKLRSLHTRLTVGAGVMVEFSRFDLSRGRIVSRDPAPDDDRGDAQRVLR